MSLKWEREELEPPLKSKIDKCLCLLLEREYLKEIIDVDLVMDPHETFKLAGEKGRDVWIYNGRVYAISEDLLDALSLVEDLKESTRDLQDLFRCSSCGRPHED